MLRWLGPRKAPEPPALKEEGQPCTVQDGMVTDDPLAAFDPNYRHRGQKQIYSVSRSVLLPRVTLKDTLGNSQTSCASNTTGGGINPLFQEHGKNPPLLPKITPKSLSVEGGAKSSSSGYGGSHGGSAVEALYVENSKFSEDAVAILEQNPVFVKSIKIAARRGKNNKSIQSMTSGSSGSGSLSTIPEGKIDASIPKPIWPREIDKSKISYDSLVDDALLLYTSLNYVPHSSVSPYLHDGVVEVREILVELFNNINDTISGKTEVTPEDMLKEVNEKIALSIETLKISTEEEMRKLCTNLKNCRKINSVLRAFNNSPTSGNSDQSSPEWGNGRIRNTSSENEDIYHNPSGSSSSGFSDYHRDYSNVQAVFNSDNTSKVPNSAKNAIVYGTLTKSVPSEVLPVKKNSLRAVNDNKPSVWEQYYGVKAVQEGEAGYAAKPTDVPLFPGGRPEADFTLDLPRSELLLKRMKKDKKWRCRCRLLTSFLGLIFFLLSVMAVSLMLTRGRRMFGSMM